MRRLAFVCGAVLLFSLAAWAESNAPGSSAVTSVTGAPGAQTSANYGKKRRRLARHEKRERQELRGHQREEREACRLDGSSEKCQHLRRHEKRERERLQAHQKRERRRARNHRRG